MEPQNKSESFSCMEVRLLFKVVKQPEYLYIANYFSPQSRGLGNCPNSLSEGAGGYVIFCYGPVGMFLCARYCLSFLLKCFQFCAFLT